MLIERERFLQRMDECLTGVVAGAGHFLFIVGEAGIGKTSLVREFIANAKNQLRVLSAACEDFSSPEPLTLIHELYPDLAAGLGASRFGVFSEALERLCSEPTLVAIEDIHWADDASIDFIRFVGRRLVEKPIMMVLTVRDDEEEGKSKLRRAFAGIPSKHRSRIDLPRLSADGVRRLALDAGLFGVPVHELTGGNPLYVNELIAAHGSPSTSLTDLVLARATGLPDSAQETLALLSVVPGGHSIAFLEAAELDAADVQQCVAAGLLVHEEEGLFFRHEVSRRAIESSLGAFKASKLHIKALRIMERLGASASRQLHHAIAAQQAEDIVRLAPLAADQASAVGAHREAAAALRRMLDHEEMLDPADAARAWRKLGFELHLLGEIESAIQCTEQALNIAAHVKDLRLVGELKIFLSRLNYLGGNWDAAFERGHQAVTLLEDLDRGPELALAYSNLAQLAMFEDNARLADEWGSRAVVLAEKVKRPDIVAHALNNIAASLQYVDPGRAGIMHDKAMDLAIGAGNDLEVARIYVNRLWARASWLDFDGAMREALRGIAYCTERDFDLLRILIIGVKATVELAMGNWPSAQKSAEEALADSAAPLLARTPAILTLATLRVRRAQPAADLLEELYRLLQNCREPGRCIPHALLCAEQAWISGDRISDALSALKRVAQMFPAHGNQFFSGSINFWHRKLSGSDLASEVPKMAAVYQRQSAGDWRGAAELWQSIGAPYERALALLDGDEIAAAEALRQLDVIGAKATAARARSYLANRGMRHVSRGPRASTKANRFGVTKRELQVLAQLEAGLTNREIGERLFVSAKTVENHVSSLIGKLGANSRRDAVGLARKFGLI